MPQRSIDQLPHLWFWSYAFTGHSFVCLRSRLWKRSDTSEILRAARDLESIYQKSRAKENDCNLYIGGGAVRAKSTDYKYF